MTEHCVEDSFPCGQTGVDGLNDNRIGSVNQDEVTTAGNLLGVPMAAGCGGQSILLRLVRLQ